MWPLFLARSNPFFVSPVEEKVEEIKARIDDVANEAQKKSDEKKKEEDDASPVRIQ